MWFFQSIDLYLKCVGGEMCAVMSKRFNEGFRNGECEDLRASGGAKDLVPSCQSLQSAKLS